MDSKIRRRSGDASLADAPRQRVQRREQLIHRVADYNKRHSLDLFRLELSDDVDGYLGALRFTYVDGSQDITKAVRLNSSTTTNEIVPHLLEKFNREQAVGEHQLAVVTNGVERVLSLDERPLEVALNLSGQQSPRFVLRPGRKHEGTPSDISHETTSLTSSVSSSSALDQTTHGQGSVSNTSLSSDLAIKTTGHGQNPAQVTVTLREKKTKTKGDKSRYTVSGAVSPLPGSGANRRSGLWKPFRSSRAKSIYGTKTADQLAQEHMKNMTQHGVLQVYGVGIAPESHSQYKSVLTTKSSTTKDVINGALERYNLEGRDEKDYLLCDVIGEWDEESRPIASPTLDSGVRSSCSPEPASKTWTTHYSRVLQSEECPLIVKTMWKSGEDFERRFELRKRPPFGRHSIYDAGTTTADELTGSGCYQHPTSAPFLMNLRGYNQMREFLVYRLIEDITAVGHADVHDGIGSNKHNVTLMAPDVLPVHCLIHQRRAESADDDTYQETQTWVEPMANASVALNGAKIDLPNQILPGDLLSVGSHYLFLFKDPSQAQEIMQGLHWEKAPLSQLEDRAQAFNEGVGDTSPSPGKARQRSSGLDEGDGHSLASRMSATVRYRLNKRLLFPYHEADEDVLIEQVVLHTDTVSVPCKLAPAYLLAMIIEYSHKEHGLHLTQELVGKIAELIQEVSWEKTRSLSDNASSRNGFAQSAVHSLLPNIQPVVFWMSNTVEVLHYLCVQLPAKVSHDRALKPSSVSSTSLQQVLGKEIQDSVSLLEEVLQFAFQQILYPLTKALYSVLPSLIEGSPFDSGLSTVTTTREIDNVLDVMQTVYDLMSDCCLNKVIIAQVFANLFFFVNASLVNTLLDNGAGMKFYHWTKGVQIRGSLDLFDAWALKNGLRKEFLQYTARLSAVADFLATTKERLLQMSWTSLRNEFPSLYPAQLHRLLSDYQLSSEVERPSHWLPSGSDCDLVNDRGSLMEEFDRCPPLFMPAVQFQLDLDYQPPGEGFQLFVDELKKLCLVRSADKEPEVINDVQETSVLSLEQSLLDNETVIRAGLGVVTPPEVRHLEMEQDSFVSLPAQSPEPQPQHQVDKALTESETQRGEDYTVGDEEGEAELELNFVSETINVVAEQSVQPEKSSLPVKQPSVPPAERSVLVPPPRPAVVALPKPTVVPPPRPPAPQQDDKPVEVPGILVVDTGKEEDSDEEEDDEGELEMDLVFSTALITDESEESPEPDVTASGESVTASEQREPLQTSGMAYIDEMVRDLESDSNSSSSVGDNDNSTSQSEDEGEIRQPSDDAADRDVDVDALMAKAALLLGDDSDDGMSLSPGADDVMKKYQNQHENKKAKKKSGTKKRKQAAGLSTVREEPETQNGSGGQDQSVTVVKLETGTKGLGLSIVDGNTMPTAVSGIFISSIAPKSPASLSGQMQVGDQVLAIGNQSLTNATENEARMWLKSAEGVVSLVIAKSKGVEMRTTELSEC